MQPRTLPRRFRRDGKRSSNACQDLTFVRDPASKGLERGDREEVRELLAPDDRGGEIGRIGASGQVVAESAVSRLEPPNLERVLGVVVSLRRQVDEQVRSVAHREVVEPQVETAG